MVLVTATEGFLTELQNKKVLTFKSKDQGLYVYVFDKESDITLRTLVRVVIILR